MSSLGSPNPFFIAGKKAYEVERSLRFNDGDSAHLSRTPSSAGNRKTFTWSAWIKRGELGATQGRCFGGGVSGSDYFEIYFPSDDGLRVIWYQGGQTLTTTTAKFRDPSAWYHFVVAVDTTQSTAGDRIKMYRNNVLLERDSTNPSQNLDTSVNNTVEHNIGKYLTGGASYFDGYMAEINFLDGYAYDPSYFAETDAVTGQWNPKKYTGSYGTNGFYLNFSTNTLGTDRSGNGNDFTPNNFSVVAGIGNDVLSDTPTNNFCTLNPLKTLGTYALSNGNLTVSGSARFDSVGTFAVSSGKWFWEITNTDVGVAYNGILNINQFRTAPGAIGSGGVYTHYVYDGTKYRDANPSGASAYGASYTDGDIVGVALNLDDNEITFYKNGTSQGAITIPNDLYTAYLYSDSGSYNYSINFGQRAFSYTAPTGYKALNSANLSNPTILLPNKHFDTLLWSGNSTNNRAITGLNFQPDFVWMKKRTTSAAQHSLVNSIVGTSDNGTGNGNVGDLDSASTRAEAAQSAGGFESFDANGFTLGKGNNDANADSAYQLNNASSMTYVGWNWNAGDTDGKTYTVKVVSDSGNKYRFDDFGTSAVTLDLAEGGTYTFDQSDSSMSSHPMQLSTTANGTHGGGSAYSTGVTFQLDGSTVTASAFISGFSSASSRKLIITVAASAPNLNYYCYYHSGMGGAVNTNSTLGSSNFDGTIQSVVKASPIAGFSIIKYTGNGTGGATIGHGLGVAPNWIIAKVRNASRSWAVGSDDSPWTLNLRLDENSGTANTSQSKNQWYETAPTSTKFYVGDGDVGDYSGDTNVNGENYVAYCFSSVEGYSKAGVYTGNASTDGPFVFCGFRPSWILIKRTSSSDNWTIFDNKRDIDNPMHHRLRANINDAEATGLSSSQDQIDFLSNGFKMRSTSNNLNGNGSTNIYLAFAESPFKNARAR